MSIQVSANDAACYNFNNMPCSKPQYLYKEGQDVRTVHNLVQLQ